MNDNLDTRFLGDWVEDKTGKIHYFHYQKVPSKHLSTKDPVEFLTGMFIKAPSWLPSDKIAQGVFHTYNCAEIEFLYQDNESPTQSYLYNFSQDGNKLSFGDFDGNILFHLSRAVHQESDDDFMKEEESSKLIHEF